PFLSLVDFCERVPVEIVNKKTIESLAYGGALDQFGERNTIAQNLESIVKFAKSNDKAKKDDSQISIFGDEVIENDSCLDLIPVPALSRLEKLKLEKQ